MAKLTKAEARKHRRALELLEKDRLTVSEREWILENYNEAAAHEVSAAGAFFTPLGLANDFLIDVATGGRVVDICAGIGHLSFAAINYHGWRRDNDERMDYVCIELNPAYVEIGRKLVPEATWICADALDPRTWEELGHFDAAISNPPFSSPHTYRHKSKNAAGRMEYAIIERAWKQAESGGFIIPQTSASFRFSGNRHYEETRDPDTPFGKFYKRTGIDLRPGCGADAAFYRDQWKNTAPNVELVFFDKYDQRTNPRYDETPAQADLFAA